MRFLILHYKQDFRYCLNYTILNYDHKISKQYFAEKNEKQKQFHHRK